MANLTGTARCETYRLRIDDLERDLGDPDLASRLASGSTVATSLVVEDGGTAYLLLVLAPPPARSRFEHPVVSVLVVLLGALVGALVGASL